jgi:hypothetical protein
MAIIIPWSGGVDSTALFVKQIEIESKKTNPEQILLLSVDWNTISKEKRIMESEARTNIRKYIRNLGLDIRYHEIECFTDNVSTIRNIRTSHDLEYNS